MKYAGALPRRYTHGTRTAPVLSSRRASVRGTVSYELNSDGGYQFASLGLVLYATEVPGRWRIVLEPCMWASIRQHETVLEGPVQAAALSQALTRQTSALRSRIAHWIGECLVADRWGHL